MNSAQYLFNVGGEKREGTPFPKNIDKKEVGNKTNHHIDDDPMGDDEIDNVVSIKKHHDAGKVNIVKPSLPLNVAGIGAAASTAVGKGDIDDIDEGDYGDEYEDEDAFDDDDDVIEEQAPSSARNVKGGGGDVGGSLALKKLKYDSNKAPKEIGRSGAVSRFSSVRGGSEATAATTGKKQQKKRKSTLGGGGGGRATMAPSKEEENDVEEVENYGEKKEMISHPFFREGAPAPVSSASSGTIECVIRCQKCVALQKVLKNVFKSFDQMLTI